MPAEFDDPSYPGLGTAGVQSRGYIEKMCFAKRKPNIPLSNGNIRPNYNGKSLTWTLGYMHAKFGYPTA